MSIRIAIIYALIRAIGHSNNRYSEFLKVRVWCRVGGGDFGNEKDPFITWKR